MAFVRVKGPDGAEFTIDERAVKGMGVTVLSKDAVDINGRPLPTKPHTDKAGQPKASAPKNDNKES
jgi:hypothetical protein